LTLGESTRSAETVGGAEVEFECELPLGKIKAVAR
jgi:hypothetical protein